MAYPKIPAEERFAKKYRIDETTGCWLWTAGLFTNGYAQFAREKGSNGYGHRFAYELHVGPIPEGFQLHHTCEVKSCVNPAHLIPTSSRKHVLELSEGEAAKNARKTKCKRGHPLTGHNLRTTPDGRRACRACMKMHQEKYRLDNREDYNAYQRDYARKRYATDEAYRERRKKASREQKGRAEPESSPPHG